MFQLKLIKKYLNEVKPYRQKVIFLSIISVFVSAIALIFAFYSKDLIDEVVNSNLKQFVFFAILLSILLVSNMIFQALLSWFQAKYSNDALISYKSEVYTHLLKTTIKDIHIYHSGTLINHLEDDCQIASDGLITIIPRFIFLITRFLGAFILLLIIEYRFALIFLSLGILLVLLSRWIAPHIRKRHIKLQQTKDLERSFTQESLENIEVIKSFQAEQKMSFTQQLKQSNVNDAFMQKTKLTILSSSGMNLFFAFGFGFALIYGGYQLQFGLTIGYLIAMIELIQHLQSPFSGFALLYPKYQQTLASIDRIDTLKKLTLESSDMKNITAFTSLHIDNIDFSYQQKSIFNEFSLVVKKNELILISGPSGAGKTTLFKLLLGYESPQRGNIEVKDYNKNVITIDSSTRSLFSYVPQDHMILSGTIKENLNLYQTYEDDKLIQVLKDVMLYDEIMKHPLKLDMMLKEKGRGLSIGQIQRLAIARALLKDAPILLLDEVTSALDIETEMRLISHLKSLKKKAIILITHHTLPESLFDQHIKL
ncbi:MAG: ABC transporter ATP-binding protein [Acholeplasmataceae bacterium]